MVTVEVRPHRLLPRARSIATGIESMAMSTIIALAATLKSEALLDPTSSGSMCLTKTIAVLNMVAWKTAVGLASTAMTESEQLISVDTATKMTGDTRSIAPAMIVARTGTVMNAIVTVIVTVIVTESGIVTESEIVTESGTENAIESASETMSRDRRMSGEPRLFDALTSFDGSETIRTRGLRTTTP